MKSRIFWIDAVKFVAVWMVVLAHVIGVVEQGKGVTLDLPNAFMTVNRMVASLGVPLFMMVSGALLLGKKMDVAKDVLDFYKRGLLPLFVTAEIWIVVYGCLNIRPFSVKELLLCLTFIHKPEVHLWYVRMIVLYYLAIPFLIWFRHRWKAGFASLVCVIIAFTFLYNGWLICHGSTCPTTPSRSYFCYLAYMAAGYVMAQGDISRMKAGLCACMGIMGGYFLYLSLEANPYFLWYDNPLLAVVAVCLFGLLKAMAIHARENRVVVEVSRMSYGIYLSHFLLVYLVGRMLENHACGNLVFWLVWVFVLLLDAAVVMGVRKIAPKAARILFRC